MIPLLRELFPLGRFAPPATESAIAAIEERLAVRLPDQLRRLYFECDGFREDRGNAKYLLSLTSEDAIGSLLTTTLFMWTEYASPDLRPFVFFGFSGGDECWGINLQHPHPIIAYHHNMEGAYADVGSDILEVFKADYSLYEGLEGIE